MIGKSTRQNSKQKRLLRRHRQEGNWSWAVPITRNVTALVVRTIVRGHDLGLKCHRPNRQRIQKDHAAHPGLLSQGLGSKYPGQILLFGLLPSFGPGPYHALNRSSR